MEKQLHVKLIKYTLIPVELIAIAARLCYSASNIDEILEEMDNKKYDKF